MAKRRRSRSKSPSRAIPPEPISTPVPSVYKTSIEKPSPHRFGAEFLHDSHKAIASFLSAEAKVTIELIGNQSISSTDLDDLLSDPLVKSKLIQQVSIAGDNYYLRPPRRVDVTIGDDRSTPISVTISGATDACILLRDRLENLIDSKRAWYAPIGFAKYSLGALAFMILTGVFYFAIFSVIAFRHIPAEHMREGSGFIAGVALVLAILLTSTTGKAVRFLFPMIEFEIGKSAERIKRIEAVRSIVFIGTVLSFLVGIASTYFMNIISR